MENKKEKKQKLTNSTGNDKVKFEIPRGTKKWIMDRLLPRHEDAGRPKNDLYSQLNEYKTVAYISKRHLKEFKELLGFLERQARYGTGYMPSARIIPSLKRLQRRIDQNTHNNTNNKIGVGRY